MRRALVCVAALLWGAAGSASAGDVSGAERTRVATLLPWAADALARVPEHARVVATVRRDLHTPPPGGVVDLGSAHSPSLEQLALARPELVIGDATLHAALREDLGRGGAEVLLVRTAGVEVTFDALREIGRRVGAGAEMEAAVREARRALDARALERPVDTLALFGAPGSFYALTERAWLGDLLARLGFRNVARSEPGRDRFPGLVPLNDEVVATLGPELLLLVTHGDPAHIRRAFEERVARGGPWRALRDSAELGVHVLDPELFAANPGLALPEAATALVDLVDEASSAPGTRDASTGTRAELGMREAP